MKIKKWAIKIKSTKAQATEDKEMGMDMEINTHTIKDKEMGIDMVINTITIKDKEMGMDMEINTGTIKDKDEMKEGGGRNMEDK